MNKWTYLQPFGAWLLQRLIFDSKIKKFSGYASTRVWDHRQQSPDNFWSQLCAPSPFLGPWGCPRWGESAIDPPSLRCPAGSHETLEEGKTAPYQKEVEAFVLWVTEFPIKTLTVVLFLNLLLGFSLSFYLLRKIVCIESLLHFWNFLRSKLECLDFHVVYRVLIS